MDPKLKAILMKSKAIDEAARKYDTVDKRALEENVNKRTSRSSSGGGLFDQMGVSEPVMSQPVNVNSEAYKERVVNSKLPPEVQKAMMENPIPQPSMVDLISEDDIRDLNPQSYSEEDEYNEMPSNRIPNKPWKQPIRETTHTSSTNLDVDTLRKMIAEELAKVLPSVVENYFDKKIIKENTRLMKVLLKSGQDRGIY